ncbi:phage integrase family protein [Acaryochloris marina MBIC11017]|uniref:Phage integrase family protein n=1 Tax=Acaryochloris marina (strain MBIC 11017) TaxID=329726 RepID=B0CCR7_ACAM1|nr:phage integrase family protein [Acaryochloris marina MBIC11017]
MRRNSRDKVQVTDDRGMIRLRWTQPGGQRTSLNLGLEHTRENIVYANGIARQIEGDMRCGQYDISKNKYRPKTIGHSGLSCFELFEKFTRYKHNEGLISARSVETRYAPIATLLKQWLNKPAHDVSRKDTENLKAVMLERCIERTVKERLWMMKSCWEWAKECQHLVGDNPWIGLTASIKVQPSQRQKPFTTVEIIAILEAFKHHRHYSHYADFVYFLFGVATRPGEAIALQWNHFGSDFQTAWIGESMSKGQRKSTKTGKARTIVLSSSIQVMLQRRCQELQPDKYDLVFPSPKGLPICERNFRERAWKTILDQCHIDYRRPYVMRHTAISHALANGADPVSVAEQSGHNKRVLLDTYAHVIKPQSVFVEFSGTITNPRA